MTDHRTSKSAYTTLRALGRTGADLLLPPRCVLCDAELEENESVQICRGCTLELQGEPSPACGRCGMNTAAAGAMECPDCRSRRFRFDRTFRYGEYQGPLRDAVLRAKLLTGEPIAAVLGAQLAAAVRSGLTDGFDDSDPRNHFDLVTCVPSFWWRRLRRGTNSAAVIAQVLARELGIPLANDLLVCRRNIEKQSSLSLAQRKNNVRGAFGLSWGYRIAGARLLLVDDVMTSGATAHEISKVLKQVGAASVAVAVVARAMGPDW